MFRISNLIRTIGRPTLERAIRSAARQTLAPLEIVVIDATGDLAPERAVSWPLVPPVRVVGGWPMNRPEAANHGLDSAQGDLLIFLDDDDEFLPSHLESLVAALASAPEAVLAYGTTACVDASGAVRGHVGQAFDRVALFEGNFIQMGAALFRRSLLEKACRFDERLESYQDWDFWLQASGHGPFVHTGHATNLWYSDQGSGGTGAGSNRDPERTAGCERLLRQKWWPTYASLVGQPRSGAPPA